MNLSVLRPETPKSEEQDKNQLFLSINKQDSSLNLTDNEFHEEQVQELEEQLSPFSSSSSTSTIRRKKGSSVLKLLFSANRNNMFYSPNRITMNKRFFKKKLMNRSLEDLQELPEWRRLLRERNVEEIQFKKTLQNKYRTDDHKVKDGYFVRKVDEYQQLKNLHKLYSIVNYNN